MRTNDVDVLIVGSGPAGSTFARTIGDALPSASILVVEVGPRLSTTPGEHTFNLSEADRGAAQLLAQGPDAGVERDAALSDIAQGIDPSAEYRQRVVPGLYLAAPGAPVPAGEVGLPVASMSSGVGGMGVHWGTACPRPHQSERIPFVPAGELDAALARAEELLQVSTDLHEGSGMLHALRAALAGEFDGDGRTPVGFLPSAIRRGGSGFTFAGPSVILGDLAQRVPGFEIRPDTLARRVLVEDGAAVGALLEDRTSGERYEVRARRVVVTADGLRTPQLLFASGVRPRALGHHLNEHFQITTFVHLSDEFDPAAFPLPTLPVLGTVHVPFSDTRRMQGGITPMAGSGFRLSALGGLDTSRLAWNTWYGAKDVRFRDAVEFSETETDFYGMPAMAIRYAHTAADITTLDVMRANNIAAAKRIGTLIEEPTLAAGGSSLHYQGTVRMGPRDDGTSVCDEHARVWGVEHLYVGGNGVIPTATAANPTLTSVALAARAAAFLAQSLTS